MTTPRNLMTAITDYVRNEVQPTTLEQRFLLKKLKERNRVKFRKDGISRTWIVQTADAGNFRSHADFDRIDYTAENIYIQAVAEYGEYLVEEILGRTELLENRGDSALIKLYQTTVDKLMLGANNGLFSQLHGGTGAAVNGGSGQGIVGLNSILPTTHAGNSWAGIAFTGNAYWQHTIVSGAADGPETDWTLDWRYILLSAINGATHGSAMSDRPDCGLTDQATYSDIALRTSEQERLLALTGNTIDQKTGQVNVSPVWAHGVPIYWDFDAQTGGVIRYLNTQHPEAGMELRFMTDDMWEFKEIRESTDYADLPMRALTNVMLVVPNPRYYAVVTNAVAV